MRWAEHVGCMGETRGAYRIFVWKSEGKRPLGRSRRRWEYNIEFDLQEVGWRSLDWVDLAQDRECSWAVVSAVMNLWVS
jgi:hypothetical protein